MSFPSRLSHFDQSGLFENPKVPGHGGPSAAKSLDDLPGRLAGPQWAPAGTLLLRSDRLTPAELADEVLARAGLCQVHEDSKPIRQARSLDSKET